MSKNRIFIAASLLGALPDPESTLTCGAGLGIFNNLAATLGLGSANTPDYPNQPGGGGGGGGGLPALPGNTGGSSAQPAPTRLINGTPAISTGYPLDPLNDEIVFVNTTVPRLITLPNKQATGTRFTVIDQTGSANSNPITIAPISGAGIVADQIEGATSISIATAFGRIGLIYDSPDGSAVAQWINVNQRVPTTVNPLTHRKVAVTAATTLLPTDEIVSVDTVAAAAATTLKLPQTPPAGTLILVEDSTGQALGSNITIQTQLPDNFGANENVSVVGSATVVGSEIISANYGRRWFYFDGAKWHLVATSVTQRSIHGPVVTGTAVVLNNDDEYVEVDATSTITVTFQPLPKLGQIVYFHNNSNTTSVVTYTGNGSQTVTGLTTNAAAATQAIAATGRGTQAFLWNGTTWMRIL